MEESTPRKGCATKKSVYFINENPPFTFTRPMISLFYVETQYLDWQ